MPPSAVNSARELAIRGMFSRGLWGARHYRARSSALIKFSLCVRDTVSKGEISSGWVNKASFAGNYCGTKRKRVCFFTDASVLVKIPISTRQRGAPWVLAVVARRANARPRVMGRRAGTRADGLKISPLTAGGRWQPTLDHCQLNAVQGETRHIVAKLLREGNLPTRAVIPGCAAHSGAGSLVLIIVSLKARTSNWGIGKKGKIWLSARCFCIEAFKSILLENLLLFKCSFDVFC